MKTHVEDGEERAPFSRWRCSCHRDGLSRGFGRRPLSAGQYQSEHRHGQYGRGRDPEHGEEGHDALEGAPPNAARP